MSMTSDKPMGIEKLNRRMPAATITDPKIVIPAIGAAFAKLDPRHMAKKSGHVRGRDCGHAHDSAVRP